MVNLLQFVNKWVKPIDKCTIVCYPASQKREERRLTMQAYCMKCRAKREIKNPKSITMKNGKPATQGVCPNCGTKVFRIGKS